MPDPGQMFSQMFGGKAFEDWIGEISLGKVNSNYHFICLKFAKADFDHSFRMFLKHLRCQQQKKSKKLLKLP